MDILFYGSIVLLVVACYIKLVQSLEHPSQYEDDGPSCDTNTLNSYNYHLDTRRFK
ncbi:hypothetical protein UFOVP435_70 [uncultured Caudovirales phage]|uniref:Uncharacterized protein n=1 Tax=uncultured Caudovirales phage TaxID=2100421 RepID=A0A6J5MDM6_9CAUD|nr:hypothetical protein UFOVP435_70 [uncultured Caudovirales phage]